MIRVPTTLLVVLFLFVPQMALGGEEPSYKESQARFDEVGGGWRSLSGRLKYLQFERLIWNFLR